MFNGYDFFCLDLPCENCLWIQVSIPKMAENISGTFYRVHLPAERTLPSRSGSPFFILYVSSSFWPSGESSEPRFCQTRAREEEGSKFQIDFYSWNIPCINRRILSLGFCSLLGLSPFINTLYPDLFSSNVLHSILKPSYMYDSTFLRFSEAE